MRAGTNGQRLQLRSRWTRRSRRLLVLDLLMNGTYQDAQTLPDKSSPHGHSKGSPNGHKKGTNSSLELSGP